MRVRPPSVAPAVALAAVTAGVLVAQQTPAAKRYALLVGVNDYQHARLPDLKYAAADVTELAGVLRGAGYEATLLTDEAGKADPAKGPTKANVEAALRAVLGRCRKGDTVVVALAGHGLQFEGQAGAFFCPADARPFADEAASLVSLTKVYAELDKSFAGMKVLLVDACRDDPSAGRGSRGIDADTAPRPPSGVAALFSCRAGERAFEVDELRHGVFFHHVLEGLRGKAKDGDGEVTFAGLAAYVTRRVARDVPKLVGGGAKQSPNLKADYSAEPVLVEVAATAPATPEPSVTKKPAPEPSATKKPAPVTVAPGPTKPAISRGYDQTGGRRAIHFHGEAAQVLLEATNLQTDRIFVRAYGLSAGEPVGPSIDRDGFAHGRELDLFASSPDGAWAAVGARDGTARVWDVRTGRPVTPPLKSDDEAVVRSIAFSPDGSRVAVGLAVYDGPDRTGPGRGVARVWDVRTGRPVTPPIAHGSGCDSIVFSPDGTRVASAGSYDNYALVWDARSGKSVTPSLTHNGDRVYICRVAFSPDGARIATGDGEGTVRLWDAKTGVQAATPLKHDEMVLCLAFSPDGTRLATGSSDDTARVWDARTGRPVTPPLKHAVDPLDLAFSPDGTRLVTGAHDRQVRSWDARTGEETAVKFEMLGARVSRVGFSPDGTRVVAVTGTEAHLYDAQPGKTDTRFALKRVEAKPD